MLATLAILAQRGTQEPPDEGTGIGLILVGIAIVIAVALLVLMAFRTYSKKTREKGPDATPHKQGHVGSGGGA